jgi:glutathionyl-hydroquinone reductase
MFCTSFAALAATPRALLPVDLAPQIEARHAHLYRTLLNAVYIAGVSILKQNEESRAAAEANIAATLDELEASLHG